MKSSSKWLFLLIAGAVATASAATMYQNGVGANVGCGGSGLDDTEFGAAPVPETEPDAGAAAEAEVGLSTSELSSPNTNYTRMAASLYQLDGPPPTLGDFDFPARFEANQAIAIFDTNGDGRINTFPGARDDHTFPLSLFTGTAAAPGPAGRHIGSTTSIGVVDEEYCGNVLIYGEMRNGPTPGRTYFIWLALRTPDYVVPTNRRCHSSDIDYGFGSYGAGNPHHATFIGGAGQGTDHTPFYATRVFSPGSLEQPGNFMTFPSNPNDTTWPGSIQGLQAAEINGGFNTRITLQNILMDVPLIHETAWRTKPNSNEMELFDFSGFGRTIQGLANSPNARRHIAGHGATRTSGIPLPSGAVVRYGDVTGDGRDDLCYTTTTGISCIRGNSNGGIGGQAIAFGSGLLGALSANERSTFQLADINGDRKMDACIYTRNGVVCGTSSGTTFGDIRIRNNVFSDANGWGSTPAYYSTIRFPDISGDGLADVCGRGRDGIYCAVSNGRDFLGLILALASFTDAEGFTSADKYTTIQYASIDGDAREDVCARTRDGIFCARSLGNGFETARQWHANFRDSYGWNGMQYASTIRLGDINGDRRADLCGRGIDGIYCTVSLATRFDSNLPLVASAFSDANGWNAEKYYRSITLVDIDGDGDRDVCGRGTAGVHCARPQPIPYSAAVQWSAVDRSIAAFGDTQGMSAPEHWSTLGVANVDADAAREFCGFSQIGLECSY